MRRLHALLAAALWLAAAAHAETPATPPAHVHPAAAHPGPAHFLASGAIDLPALVPDAPAPDSLVQRAELDVLYHLQLERTPGQVARARVVNAEDVFVIGSDVLGEWFNQANLPRSAAFFALVTEDMTPFNQAAKTLFHRRRPPFVDPRIKPCVEPADTGSYPSGHAMRAALWAALLGTAFPEQAAALQARAEETRWGRLLAGVHFPSDVEAGRTIGEALAREMLKHPAVQQALEQLRAEAAPFRHKKAA
jgi:acid phosphatase (class A)